MNFARSSRRSLIRPFYSDLKDLYPHNLQFYRTPPSCEVTVQELEDCVAQRLSLLQTLEEVNNRGLKSAEWRHAVLAEIRKQDAKNYRKLVTNTTGNSDADLLELYEMRKWDHISHFMLRLAYCTNEDKRRWFIAREVDLFRFRWEHLSFEEKQTFLDTNDFKYEKVSNKEKMNLGNDSNGMVQISSEYYKVPFSSVPDLIRTRRVYLSKGVAYIGADEMLSVIITCFRTSLSKSLAYANRRINNIADDTRITGLLKGAGNSQRNVDYSPSGNRGLIDIRNLDTLAEISYPLCMQNLHKKLRKEHHLKHFARLQYILFLKGIGVTLEDAMRFWKSEFTKKMEIDKFEKEYAYNVRHSYGKAGKMANYSPHSCLKIINASVSAGDAHGCPFKHSDQVTLKKSLMQNGLSTFDAQEVLDFVKKGHYQIACGVYFQKKHNVETITINHPNHYFDESQMVLNNKLIKNELKAEPQETTKSTKPSTSKAEEDYWGNDSEIDFSSVSGY